VPFILPRTFLSEQRKREKLIDGTATILLSHIVEDIDCCESESSISPIDVKVNSRSSDNLTTDDDASMCYIEKSSSKSSNVCSMDVPFDAHMLPRRGRCRVAQGPIERPLPTLRSSDLAPIVCGTRRSRRRRPSRGLWPRESQRIHHQPSTRLQVNADTSSHAASHRRRNSAVSFMFR